MSKTMKVALVGELLLALSAGMAAAQIVAQDVITCSKGGRRGATVRRATTGTATITSSWTAAVAETSTKQTAETMSGTTAREL